MSQFENLSEVGRNIVDNYLSDKSNFILGPKKKKELMASLYAMMDGTNPKVLSILGESVKNLRDTLSKEDIDILRAEYPSVMKYCFEKRDPINESMYYVDNNGYTNKMLPKSLLELCLKIAYPDKGDNVFLPYAGFTQIALSIPEAYYCGFEQNEDRWALSQMMLHACGIPSSIALTDDMFKSIPEGKKFDYIFCMPPFANGEGKKRVANNINELATKYLVEKGIMCCILPKIFCFAKSGWFDVRKILCDYQNQYSAIVITLPQLPKVFNGTKLCLFYLIKDGRGEIELMDASRNNAFIVMDDPEYYEDWDYNVDSIIAIRDHGSRDFCWYGKVEDLKKEVDLTPSHYLLHETNTCVEEKKYDLGDLIEIVPTEQIVEDVTCPIIGIKELSDNYLNCDIPFNAVPKKKAKNAYILTENCLLVGVLGDTIRVGKTVDLSSEQFIALSPYVLPIRLKSKKVSEDFLLRNFMLNDDLREEVRMLPIGLSFTRLAKQEFLEMQIVVPTREEQNRLVMADSKTCITDAEQKLKEAYEEFRNDIHMKKHAIGQTLFNLNNWWSALLQARKEGNGVVADDASTGKIRKVAVSSIYDSLQKAISQLQQQINKFDRGNGLIVKEFALTEFIENYIEHKQSPLFTFFYESTPHHAPQTLPEIDEDDVTGEMHLTGNILIHEGDPIEYVEFAPDALEIIFDNIISNACCHGFKDSPDKQNIIRIDLKSEKDNYVIIISNNGSAMHSQIKPSEVFIYGKTSKMGRGSEKDDTHFGIGGYEIKKLMQEFGGDAEIISEPESDFPVSYKLTFFNTNIESVIL